MRTPSRRMHDAPMPADVGSPGLHRVAWALPTALLVAVCLQPRLLWVVAGLAVLGLGTVWRERRHLARLAAQRQGESICQFARAFAWRRVDTWVIRAVYASLHGHLGGQVPIRADDRLKQDLWLDDEDLDLDLLAEMARLSGRSLERTADNPWFDRVTTVRDLVAFLEHQPRLAPA